MACVGVTAHGAAGVGRYALVLPRGPERTGGARPQITAAGASPGERRYDQSGKAGERLPSTRQKPGRTAHSDRITTHCREQVDDTCAWHHAPARQ